MPRTAANGIEIEYDTHGNPSDPPLLLIMGLSAQLTKWEDEFVTELVQRGLYAIRFDNRDIGLSTFFDEAGVPDLGAALTTGVPPAPAYSIVDMADDAAGLLEALNIDRAHIVGASMGGMIAQALAINHPAQTLSLCSIMSTTGNPAVGYPHEGVLQAMLFAPVPTNREEAADAGIASAKLIGSPGFPMHEERLRYLAAAAYERSHHPEGVVRQALAVGTQADRTDELASVAVPTLVIHGEDDPLVDVSGGRATAEAIPGAELWTIPGMGHDLPLELFSGVADRIAANCRRAG